MKIAINRCSITPQKPCRMAGYAMRKQNFSGIHDELEAVTMWIQNETACMLFISMDVIGVDESFCDEVRRRIKETVDIEKDHVIISGLHTHAGPVFYHKEHSDDVPDQTYREYVTQNVVHCALSCKDELENVNPCMTDMEIDGIYSNRNDIHKYGDKHVYLLEFYHKERRVAALCCLSCHATVLGPDNDKISADLTGNTRRALEAKLHCPVLLINGCAGDMSNRQYRRGNDFAELARVVEELSEQIIRKRNPHPICMDHGTMFSFHFPIQYQMDHEALKENIILYEQKLKTETDYDSRKLLKSGIAAMERKRRYDEVFFSIDCMILNFDGIRIITIPGELVSLLGKRIKEASDKTCILWGYANGSIGYIVEKEEYGKAHESISSLLPIGKPEEFTEHLISAM